MKVVKFRPKLITNDIFHEYTIHNSDIASINDDFPVLMTKKHKNAYDKKNRQKMRNYGVELFTVNYLDNDLNCKYNVLRYMLNDEYEYLRFQQNSCDTLPTFSDVINEAFKKLQKIKTGQIGADLPEDLVELETPKEKKYRLERELLKRNKEKKKG